MKYSSLKAFEKHLESAAPAHLSNIYTLIAKDRSDQAIALNRLLSFVVPQKNKENTTVKTFSDPSQHADLIEELCTFSLLSKNKVIVVREAESLKGPILQKLEKYIANPDPVTYLILVAAAASAKSSLFKVLEKYGVVLEIPEEKPWEKEKTTQEWLFTAAAQVQKKLSPQACKLLMNKLGHDKLTLSMELEKLICFAGERSEITVQDIEKLCPLANTETHWQLNEAIFRRDAPSALRVAKSLLTEGWAFIKLARHLRSQFQTVFQIASIMESGGQIGDVKERFPQMKDFALQKNVQAARQYGIQALPTALQAIDAAELMFKDGVDDSELLTDLLIIKLTS